MAWQKIHHFKDTILNPKYSNQYCTALRCLLHMNEHRSAEGGDTLFFSLCLTLPFPISEALVRREQHIWNWDSQLRALPQKAERDKNTVNMNTGYFKKQWHVVIILWQAHSFKYSTYLNEMKWGKQTLESKSVFLSLHCPSISRLCTLELCATEGGVNKCLRGWAFCIV